MMVNAPIIAVLAATTIPQRQTFANDLAQQLGLAIVNAPSKSSTDLFLTVTNDRLELRDRTPHSNGVAVDFGQLDARTITGRGSKNQPIVRAFGRETRTIVDATAGLGQDAALLACMGFQVTAVERSPVIAALLEDGLRRAMDDERLRDRMRDRLIVIHGDARTLLQTISATAGGPDAVYLDPMFPPKRKKSALPSRSIRLVRAVVGDDEDAADLLQIAMKTATQRVVVKRPNYAPPLGKKPTVSYKGKLARFDVYRV